MKSRLATIAWVMLALLPLVAVVLWLGRGELSVVSFSAGRFCLRSQVWVSVYGVALPGTGRVIERPNAISKALGWDGVSADDWVEVGSRNRPSRSDSTREGMRVLMNAFFQPDRENAWLVYLKKDEAKARGVIGRVAKVIKESENTPPMELRARIYEVIKDDAQAIECVGEGEFEKTKGGWEAMRVGKG
jgi:hypothetical protein